MSGLKVERVLESVKVVARRHDAEKRIIRIMRDYHASLISKVLRIVLIYMDHINRTVRHGRLR